jgi:predicted phosphoribosyltransferase
MGPLVFRDRREAGQVLASRLERYRDSSDVVVMALPRGGVPVAYEVARELRAPLDVFVVRKLGAPGFPEIALGAIASGDVVVTNDDVIGDFGITPDELEPITEAERRELHRREKAYRDGRPPADIKGKTIIVVDDGLATGATMLAALKGIRAQSPGRVVLAVPVAPEDTCEGLSHIADEVVCVTTPKLFIAVGAAYSDFEQTSDDEVQRLLAAPTRRHHLQPADQ